jgi:hypothetical protein
MRDIQFVRNFLAGDAAVPVAKQKPIQGVRVLEAHFAWQFSTLAKLEHDIESSSLRYPLSSITQWC